MKIYNKYITLTDENFEREVIRSVKPVLVDFYISWSGSTQIMTPVIKRLASEFEDRIKVGRLDIERNPQASNTYSVRTSPTFLFFNNGKVVDQVVGMARKIELAKILNAILKNR